MSFTITRRRDGVILFASNTSHTLTETLAQLVQEVEEDDASSSVPSERIDLRDADLGDGTVQDVILAVSAGVYSATANEYAKLVFTLAFARMRSEHLPEDMTPEDTLRLVHVPPALKKSEIWRAHSPDNYLTSLTEDEKKSIKLLCDVAVPISGQGRIPTGKIGLVKRVVEAHAELHDLISACHTRLENIFAYEELVVSDPSSVVLEGYLTASGGVQPMDATAEWIKSKPSTAAFLVLEMLSIVHEHVCMHHKFWSALYRDFKADRGPSIN